MLEYEVRRKIASAGDPEAKLQVFLHVYENLPELEEKLPDALDELKEAASAGSLGAQYMLGYIQLQGDVVAKSVDDALAWLAKAGKGGHLRAKYWTGEAYEQIYENAESEQAKLDAAEQAVYWWTLVIEDPETPDELALAAQRSLALHYIRVSAADDRGWDLLIDAANKGYEPAVSSLNRFRQLMADLRDKGFADAVPIIERLDDWAASYPDKGRESEEPGSER